RRKRPWMRYHFINTCWKSNRRSRVGKWDRGTGADVGEVPHCRPGAGAGAGAGSGSGTQVPERMWDGGAELSHRNTTSHGAPGRNRTCDTRFRKPLLYPLSYEGEGWRNHGGKPPIRPLLLRLKVQTKCKYEGTKC